MELPFNGWLFAEGIKTLLSLYEGEFSDRYTYPQKSLTIEHSDPANRLSGWVQVRAQALNDAETGEVRQ